MDSAQHIVKLGPTAVELVDRTMIELARANPAFRPTIEAALIGMPAAILLVEFSGDDQAMLQDGLREPGQWLGALMRSEALTLPERHLGLPGSVVEMPDEAPQKALWEVRKAGLNIMMSLKGDGKPVSFIEDCAVPLEHLADYTDALTEVFARHGTRGTWYAHASVGTLHVRPILDMRRDGAAKMRAIAEEAATLVRRYQGAFSGEHGDGLCRGEWIRWQFGAKLDDALRAIKQHLDPTNLLNPGKIIDPPRMDQRTLFRFAPGYRTIALKPVFDWSAWNVQNDPVSQATTAPGSGGDNTGGLAKAVEMCNNNGHCRKFDAGTMCPSYRVTRDEQHLTRGRANTLRLALSGQIEGGFTSDAVQDALDLCVGCKGCRRDCPTGVDMAKMKLEFAAQRATQRGVSLRDRLIGQLPLYAPLASRLAWFFNLRDRLPGVAWLSEKWLGLSAQRTLPQWRRDTFARVAPTLALATQEQVLAAHARDGHGVVLFVDTFNGHFETENASDAVRVLQAAGYAVHVATRPGGAALCCGRTLMGAGLAAAAKARAQELIEAFTPFVDAGLCVVGLEPSCLLTMRDEMLVMGLGAPAQLIGQHALLLEEFLAREASAGKLDTLKAALQPTTAPILLHGHCHQKAFGAVSPILDVIKLIPGAQPALIESSCCGMAGSFGYEAAHYDVSMQMAELSLLPAVRQQPNAIVVADGTSCRHQIRDGAQREAIHVAVLLAQQLQK